MAIDRPAGRVRHAEHFRLGPQVLLRVAMATNAPLHEQRLGLKREVHLVDLAVATLATHALRHVNRVVEIGVVRHVVDAVPLHRFVFVITLAQGFEDVGTRPHLLVAVHAGLGRRDAGEVRIFYRGVAVAAIDSELADVVSVAECDGLGNDFFPTGGIARTVERRQPDARERERHRQPEHEHPTQWVHTLREYLGHPRSPFEPRAAVPILTRGQSPTARSSTRSRSPSRSRD